MDNLLYKLGKIPGALMILPLFLGALINTFAPAICISAASPRLCLKMACRC